MTLRQIILLVATGMTSFFSTYLAAAVNLALKSIGTEFGVGPSRLSLVASVYLLFTSICLIPFGKVSDTFGPKRTLVFGCGFFILSNLMVPLFVHDFTSLVIARGLQGIAAAFLLVSNTPIVTAIFPREQRATALGVLSGMVYFGYSVGNYVGGMLTQYFGWRSIFVSAAFAGIVTIVILQLLIPERTTAAPKVRSFDLPGLLYYATALICLQIGTSRLTSIDGAVLLAVSAVTALLFIRRQWNITEPMYDLRLFVANKVFAASNMAVFLNFFATYGSYYLLPLYLQINRGLSPAEVGKITLLQPLMQLFFSPIGGIIADRFSPALVASGGMALITGALLLLSQLGPDTSMTVIYAALIMTGIGISFFSAPNTSIIMGAVPENRRGMAAASNSIMRNLGMQFSIILCGVMFLLALGTVKGIQPEQHGTLLHAIRLCYGIFAVCCGIGMVISLKRPSAVEMAVETSRRDVSAE